MALHGIKGYTSHETSSMCTVKGKEMIYCLLQGNKILLLCDFFAIIVSWFQH